MRRLSLFALLAAAGCDDGVASLSGLDAMVIVANAQFVPGAMPAAMDGPGVDGIDSLNNVIWPGQRAKKFSGRLDKGGTAVAIGFDGDVGYWTLAAGAEDILFPGQLTFDSVQAFSRRLQPATKYPLVFRAVDAGGRFGAPRLLNLQTQDDVPDGDLVVTLAWDTEADLDLHMVVPNGDIVWSRKSNAYQPMPGNPADPAAAVAGGHLDFDSNAGCVIDGRRRENIVFAKTPAAAGHYIVRVDTFSLCGEGAARWTLEALHQGTSLQKVSGISGDSDTRTSHEAASGLTALEFDL